MEDIHMKLVKSLLLGSATALVASVGALAAAVVWHVSS